MGIPTTMDTTDMDIGDTLTDMDTTTERGPLMLMKPQPQDQTQMLKLMLGMDTMAIDTMDMDIMDIHTDTTMVRDLLMSLLLLVQTLMLMPMLMLGMDMLDTTDADTMDIHIDMDTTMATMDIHTDTTGAESKQTKTDKRHLPT